MPEFNHPGVYVQERRTGLTPIQGVSTSNMGIVGFTDMGPTNEAVLVTSFPAFERTFGTFIADSQVPTHTYAFFANGGRRAYVVRVVSTDPSNGAVSADGFINSDWAEETIATGDGVTVAMDSASPSIGEVDFSHVPEIEPGSITVSYYPAGTPVTGQDTNASPAPDGSYDSFTGRIVVAGDAQIVPGTVTLDTTVSTASVPYTDPAKDGLLKDAGSEVRGYIDYETGHYTLSVESGQEPDAASTIDADYTPVGTQITVTDDGVGGWNSPATAGAIDYTTGVWSMTVATAPADQIPVQAAYTQQVWDIDPISAGAWGNNLRLDVRGDDDYFTRGTASYSRYDVLVYLYDSELASYDLQETFEGLSFTDSTDAKYVGSVLNNVGVGSSLLGLVEPSNEDVGPRNLSGYQRSRAVGGGNTSQAQFGSTDGTGGTANIPVGIRSPALATPVQPGSVSITYTDVNGTARTITDDGSGNLTGDVDGAAAANFNVVDYDTGDFAFQVPAGQEPAEAETSHAATPTGPVPGSIITGVSYIEPTDTLQQETLTGGSNGTAPIGRSELTNPSLLTDREGMYALLPTDELINLTIPDAAGNVTMSNDQITEAERNEKWFIILATPQGYTPQQARDYRVNTLGANSSYAALYYPWITIADPVTDLPTNIPPGGHIAGVYARTDSNKSVGKAPAGTEDGKLLFSEGLERTLEFEEVDILHPKQVNALMDTPQTGRAVWGARTLENPPSDFRYVHARRLFNFLKKSIFDGTHGFVFEDVGPSLWSRIRLSIESFMLTLFGQGLFKGETPAEAFTVICDETNNPQNVQDAGLVYCDIYVAVNVPGEFIVFRLQQQVSQAAA